MQNRTAGSSLAFTSRDKSKSFRLEAEKQVGGAGGGGPWRLSPTVTRGRRWLTKRKAARLPLQCGSPTPTPRMSLSSATNALAASLQLSTCGTPKGHEEQKLLFKKNLKTIWHSNLHSLNSAHYFIKQFIQEEQQKYWIKKSTALTDAAGIKKKKKDCLFHFTPWFVCLFI